MLIGLYWFFSTSHQSKSEIRLVDSNSSIEEIQIQLGKTPLIHRMENFDEELANIGEELIRKGKSAYNGKRGKLISSYFVCTDCHNLVKESTNINDYDAQQRLDYAVANKIPFLPGSTLFGVYNRTSFYNGDYDKKYGELVYAARDTLQNAIQLCAEYCASGRRLENWELVAMMHYFKKNELKMQDLSFNSNELAQIQEALDANLNSPKNVTLIQSKYPSYYNAHFPGTMDLNNRKYGEGGDIQNGEKLFQTSCLFCHLNARVTNLELNNDVLTGQYLWKNRETYENHSVYQIVRWGTYPIVGRKQYMPLYTTEKMSDDQLEDLMAYIKKLAKK